MPPFYDDSLFMVKDLFSSLSGWDLGQLNLTFESNLVNEILKISMPGSTRDDS